MRGPSTRIFSTTLSMRLRSECFTHAYQRNRGSPSQMPTGKGTGPTMLIKGGM